MMDGSCSTHDSELGNFSSGGQRGDRFMDWLVILLFGIPLAIGICIVVYLIGGLFVAGHFAAGIVSFVAALLLLKIYSR